MTFHLSRDVSRCLAHGYKHGEWCPKRYECARHEAIGKDARPSDSVVYRACDHSDSYAMHIPLTGFPPRED
jgi:hypothetical protein